jgi:hypothetical protein
MSFYFGISFQGMYLPWALCGFELLLGGVPLQYFAGIFTVKLLQKNKRKISDFFFFFFGQAHVFYYVTEVMPRVSGKPSFLQTPQFL